MKTLSGLSIYMQRGSYRRFVAWLINIEKTSCKDLMIRSFTKKTIQIATFSLRVCAI